MSLLRHFRVPPFRRAMMQAPPLGLLVICSALVAQSCGHAAPAASARPATAKPARAALPQAAPPEPRAITSEAMADALGPYMPEHFAIITWARDMVINGELERTRVPLRALAEHTYKDVAPGPWMTGIARVQTLARATAEASGLPVAAAGVASMARQCGACHREVIEAPLIDELAPYVDASRHESLADRMQRHAWALDRMWEGLVLPSKNAWTRGATALAQAPYEAPRSDQSLSPEAEASLVAMRELGAEALEVEDWGARADVYGRLIVGCASCHRQPMWGARLGSTTTGLAFADRQRDP